MCRFYFKDYWAEKWLISVFIVRHLTPAGYGVKEKKEALIEEKAKAESAQTAKEIVENCPDDSVLAFYGGGTRPRHERSLELLEKAIENQVEASGKNIEIIGTPPTATKRKSLRPGPLWKFTEVAPGQEMDYWLTEEVEKGIEPPAHAAKRLNNLLRGLVRYTKRQRESRQVTWVLITSGEVVGAWTKNLPEVNKVVGLKPGR